MAETQVSSLASAGTTAFDRKAFFALRSKLQHVQFATVKGEPFHVGGVVQFNLTDDLATATSALSETTDVTPVAMSDSTVNVTLVEYGNVVRTTRKARGTAYRNIDSDAANVIGYNAGNSIDEVARGVLVGGTNVTYADTATSTATVGAAMTLGSDEIREAVATMRGNSAPPLMGELYAGLLHPDQAVDLRAETGGAGWTEPVNNSEAARRWMGVVGIYEGVGWIESPRVRLTADAGVTTTDVYDALIIGDEALAMAYSSSESAALPQVVRGEVTDTLRRLVPVGWYWLGGFSIFREESLHRIETASSIGAN